MAENWIDRLADGASLPREDRERLAAIEMRERRFDAGQVLVFEEDEAPLLFFVEEGWAAAVRDLADGSMQILDLFLSGQIMGLREVASDDAVSSYRALTDLEVRLLRKSEMQRLIDEFPAIGHLVLQAVAREQAWLMERITMLGQKSAAECLVHLLLELSDRLALAAGRSDSRGPEAADGFELPLNQEQLGNIIGITPVHVSRTLKELSGNDLLKIEDHRVSFLDRPACERFAGYDLRRMRLLPDSS